MAFHLNELRKVNKIRTHFSGVVPDMPIHYWFKNVEKPTVKSIISKYLLNFQIDG